MISFLNDKSFRNELAALEYHLEMSWRQFEYHLEMSWRQFEYPTSFADPTSHGSKAPARQAPDTRKHAQDRPKTDLMTKKNSKLKSLNHE